VFRERANVLERDAPVNFQPGEREAGADPGVLDRVQAGEIWL